MFTLLMLLFAADPQFVVENKTPVAFVVLNRIPAVDAAAAPTPHAEIARVLAILPAPQVAFVEIGTGAYAPWCFAAVEKWGCKAVGIEIDHARASVARERVKAAGLGHLITIIEGDAVTTEISGDVCALYLYPSLIDQLRPRLAKMRAAASYMHPIPGLATTRNGDTFIYVRTVETQTVLVRPTTAEWAGRLYSGRVCGNSSCLMCAEIQRKLSATVAVQVPKVEPPKAAQAPQPANGHWENRQFCSVDWRGRKTCSIQAVWVPDR